MIKFNDENCFKKLNEKYGYCLLDIPAPIIGVFRICEKSETQVLVSQIYNEFISRGYIVSQISSFNSDFKQCYKFPVNLFSSTRSDIIQLYSFNQMIYEICKIDKPDIIIIELPVGIIPICDEITNDFGIMAFKVACSVNIDIAFINVFADIQTKEYLTKLEKLFLYRFSIENLYIGVLNKMLDWSGIRAEKRLKIMHANDNTVKKVIKGMNSEKVFIQNNVNGLKRVINNIEADLIDNAVVDVF